MKYLNLVLKYYVLKEVNKFLDILLLVSRWGPNAKTLMPKIKGE